MIEIINEGKKKSTMLEEENENLQKEIEINKNKIICLNNELKGYKGHFIILNNQNKVLSKELDYLVERDKKLSEEFQIFEHLKEVMNKNNELIKKCIDN